MKIHTLGVLRTIDAPSGEVWTLLADPATWAGWAPYATPDRDWPGVERAAAGPELRLRAGSRTIRVRTTSCDAPRRLSYELVSGLPVRRFRGEVTLRSQHNQTELLWTALFRPSVPGTGWLIRRHCATVLDEIAARLTARAEDPPVTRMEMITAPLEWVTGPDPDDVSDLAA